ncbi:MAG: DUF2182 domain-containing protein [Flavimaricola sp.]|nr:DUF2182 domain-containing protein [Flavimaricola sp.]
MFRPSPAFRLIPLPSLRALIWLCFYTVIMVAWLGLVLLVRQDQSTPTGFWQSLCLPATSAGIAPLWGMWALMSAAMMLPTFAPTLATYLDLGQAGATRGREAAALIVGYLAVWLGASALGALAQMALSSVTGAATSKVVTVVLLAIAGLYQLSPAKAACLAKCRMPLTYFLGRWRPGVVHAARMGGELGLICLGCCWALMFLGLIGGAMSLLWMGAATLFMIFEKLPDLGRVLTRPAGYALLAAAGLTALSAVWI